MLVLVHAVTGFLQLCALVLFGIGVYYLNSIAPRRMAARSFKLYYLLATVGVGLILIFLAAKVVNLPARVQHTPVALTEAHNVIRASCESYRKAQRFDEAYATISKRTKTAELVGSHLEALKSKDHKTSLARLVSPALNTILFHTGVTVAFLPALLRLLLLLWQKRQHELNGPTGAHSKFAEKERREWGVFLPIMNTVTLLSLCVSPTFYFFIEPNRAHRCIYTSGHWYTFSCTLLTFAIVITHLYRNRDYCKSSYTLLSWYFIWCVAYLGMAMTVLGTTQTFYHDHIEAVDGMMQAIPAFICFTIILIVYQFLTASGRDVSAELKRAKTGVLESADEIHHPNAAAKSSEEASNAKKKAKKILGLEEQPKDVSEKAKKILGLDEQKTTKKEKPVEAAAPTVDEDEDTVIVDAAEATPISGGSPVATPSSAPSAPPMAPPLAPPPPSASTQPKPLKIVKKDRTNETKAAPLDTTAAMLEGIKKGVQLRHVTPGSSPSSSSSSSSSPINGGLMDQLAARLRQARIAIDGEKEEEKDAEWETN